MEVIDAESAQIRETFAHFGRAIYCAQALERQLAMLLASVYGPGKFTGAQFDDLLDSNFSKTLGILVKRLKKESDVSTDLLRDLTKALKQRN